MNSTPLLWLLALTAGALIPVQAAANAALSKAAGGNVPFSAVVLFLVAGSVALAAVGASGAGAPTWGQLRAAPWWSYCGGLIVAVYVLTVTFLAPRLGVGAAIALIVAGQIAGALLIDHLGLLRSPVFPLTPSRAVGAGLMAAGVFLAVRR